MRNLAPINLYRTGLTIPLQITLSNIKLSAFIVLVFSKQKGLTLVFRNDPLESLKVSSTFDSIPFVRDFLQKEIEGQLRILLMDELPAIIHRLSLRLWVPEYRAREDQERTRNLEDQSSDEPLIDPLAVSPEDPVDATGNALNPAEIASLSLDSSIETHALFSQKNLLRLAALTDSHRTLSLFTPLMRDAVFRAGAGSREKLDLLSGFQSPRSPPSLSRTHSYSTVSGTGTTYSFDSTHTLRPGLSHASSYSLSMGGARNPKAPGARKRKKRVVNLRRRNTETGELESVSGDSASYTTESAPTSTSSAPTSAIGEHPSIFQKANEEIGDVARPSESEHNIYQRQGPITNEIENHATPTRRTLAEVLEPQATTTPSKPPPRRSYSAADFDIDATPRASMYSTNTGAAPGRGPNQNADVPYTAPHAAFAGPSSALPTAPISLQPPLPPIAHFPSPFTDSSSSNGYSSTILEQAWMMKMAGAMAQRYQEDNRKEKRLGLKLGDEEDAPPPAYTG